MALNLHPADEADIAKIATATHFNVHLRIGPAEKIDRKAKTLAAAIKIADELGMTPGGRKPLIYAVTPDKMTMHVPAAMIAQARQEIEQKAAAGRKRARAGVEALARANASMVADNPEAFARPARKAASKAKGARPIGRRAEIAENAAKGVLPPVPDFSADTHKRFRGKLAEIVALVEAGDVAALKAIEINPYSSSPKALARYRDLAMVALLAGNAALS